MSPLSSTQVILTPADFADTGQWRLIICISRTGICAFLKHTSDHDKPVAELFRSEWRDDDPATLLKNIENAVYDHPALLDDYATYIIVDTQHTTFVPSLIIDTEDEIENDIFSTLYPDAGAEVSVDRIGHVTALFSLCGGLDGFLSRTLPGARIRNNLAILVEHFGHTLSEAPRIYIDIRPGVADIIAFDGARFIAASSRGWRVADDIAYMAFHLLQSYSLPPEKAEIFISGLPGQRIELSEKLRNYCAYVAKTTLPDIVEKYSLPVSAGLLMNL